MPKPIEDADENADGLSEAAAKADDLETVANGDADDVANADVEEAVNGEDVDAKEPNVACFLGSGGGSDGWFVVDVESGTLLVGGCTVSTT